MASDIPQADSFRQDQRLRIIILGAFFIGIFLLALGGGLFLFRGREGAGDIQIISSDSDTVSEKAVVVHVDGAVNVPGVYKLAADARIGEAVNAAGGFAQNADTKNVNLAAKIADGQKIYVPAVGGQLGSSQVGSLQAGQSGGDLININTASQSQLESLPAIGPVTAQKIIALRPYNTLEDLLTKKVVGSSTFEKVKGLISVY